MVQENRNGIVVRIRHRNIQKAVVVEVTDGQSHGSITCRGSLPADNFNGNKIIGNYIAGNLADSADTATPGRVGININSGGGGSPVYNTTITENVIEDEDVDVAVNTPAEVDIHLNDLLGGKIGVADVCALDKSAVCMGNIDATENYWGCHGGPGGHGCSTESGTDIRFTPWLKMSATQEDNGAAARRRERD